MGGNDNMKKIWIVLLVSSLIGLFVLSRGHGQKDELMDGNATKPMINVDGNIYGTSMNRTGDISEDYTFYGYVNSAAKEMIEVPSDDLEVSKIIEDNIGYRVYRSQDKDFVAIFNESTQKYDYFEKIILELGKVS